MSESRNNAAERNFQENFVREMTKYRWSAPNELNGNLQRVTVNDLIENWREELNNRNQDQLEGVPLTDNEFKQVMAKVKSIHNSYEAAKLLAIEGSVGKIDGIHRDKHPDVTRPQITLTIFNKSQVGGGTSTYKIAREVVSNTTGNRFDMILLINGLPLINIEQKRTDKTVVEAYGQFKRYYRDGDYTNNFLAFSQMMVITSEIDTRYFATPKSLDDFNMSFLFSWKDRDNKAVNQWQDVIKKFLMIPMAHQMVGDYLVIDEAINEADRKHMLMRPYQVYALQAIELAALGFGEGGIPHGGFVWHTTGSGKTITSFKTALFLATRASFDKIIFLVDRRELDNKTSENFKAYAAYEPVSVDATPHTYRLGQELKSSKSGIVVTTTFKLNSLVKDLIEHDDYSLAKKKIVFIIDEAHRTTMGGMMVTIKEYFKEHGLFYGFTGTPLFDENKAKGMVDRHSEVINTTKKLFGPELHKYTIDEAIADRNVLGFNVDYINTGEFESYDALREDLLEHLIKEDPKANKYHLERKLVQMSERDIEDLARKEKILVYYDETHIPQVVKEILKHWEDKSRGRYFNAILTVAYKQRVIDYYHEFKRQLADWEYPINIAITFSLGNENDPASKEDAIIEEMFSDYETFTGIKFITGDKMRGFDNYFADIVDRTTRGGSGRNPKNIDLVIVADQLLTGYDSKRLNTLYVDRNLELQGLIQAYSRTNRVYGPTKEFGSIVNFQYPRLTKERVDQALELYGSGGSNSKAIVDPYETAVKKLKESISFVQSILDDPTEWKTLKNDEEKMEEFQKAFRDANNQLNTVKQYYQYEWTDEDFGLDEHQWMRYTGAYKNLETKGEDPEVTIDFPELADAKLVGSHIIDAIYIINLLDGKAEVDHGKKTVDKDTLRIVYEHIQELSNLGEDDKAQLLKQFVDEMVITNQISADVKIEDAFQNWKDSKLNQELKSYATQWGVDTSILNETFKDYDTSSPENVPYLSEITESVNESEDVDLVGVKLMVYKNQLKTSLSEWLKETKSKYRD